MPNLVYPFTILHQKFLAYRFTNKYWIFQSWVTRLTDRLVPRSVYHCLLIRLLVTKTTIIIYGSVQEVEAP